MSSIPDEASLEHPVVSGNCGDFVVVTVALGAALRLEPDGSVSPLPLECSGQAPRRRCDTSCFWLDLQRMGPVRNRLGEEARWVPGKELGSD